MHFLTSLYFKHTYLLQHIFKNSDFCSFFQINTNSFDFLNKMKQNLFNLNLRFIFCKKTKLLHLFDKITKGAVYIIFSLNNFNFLNSYDLFIQFIYENNPKIICICIFFLRHILHFNCLKKLFSGSLIYEFVNTVSFLFLRFYILCTIYAKKV